PVVRDGCCDISHRYFRNRGWELRCHAELLSSVLPQAIAGSCYVPRCAGHGVFPCAPARRHSVRRAQENRFDLPDLAFLDPEHLGDLPGPWIRRAAGHGTAVRRLERAVLAERVVEKDEAVDETAFR